MKLSNTKGAKKISLIKLPMEGVYMKAIPMLQLQELFSGLEDGHGNAIDSIFSEIIVDAKGEMFDELKDGQKATETLSMPVIEEVMASILEKLNPTGK